jgi:transcription elongation GreA/GreB family factor
LTNFTEIKKQLHLRCTEIINQRIAVAKQTMDDAQASANQEDKSSAGDKYETGRAMAQIARDQAAQQLDETLKLKQVLDQINFLASSTRVGLGSLVVTDKNHFYISVSIGKLRIEEQEYFVVSPNSPIGKLLLNKKVNDPIVFNQQQQTISAIL